MIITAMFVFIILVVCAVTWKCIVYIQRKKIKSEEEQRLMSATHDANQWNQVTRERQMATFQQDKQGPRPAWMDEENKSLSGNQTVAYHEQKRVFRVPSNSKIT